MKREELLRTYEVCPAGYITSPGKLRGERLYIPHFWGKAVQHRRWITDTSPDGVEWRIFPVTKEDREEYPELERVESVGVREDQGFVVSWIRACSYRQRR